MTTAHEPVSDANDAPPPGWLARIRTNFASEAKQIFGVFQCNPEWAVIVFAWLAAAFIPAFWFMGEERWWIESRSPLFFEPFVPLLSAALLWRDRRALQEAWQMTPRHKRRGSPWLLWLGCILVLVSHLIHVLTVAAIGLVVAAAGIIYIGYGPFVLTRSSRVLAFALLFAPPPLKVITTISKVVSSSAWSKITTALQRIGLDASCTTGPDFTTLVIKGNVINAPNNQLSTIVVTGFLLLFIAIWRRDRVGTALLSMAFGSLLGGFLSVIVPFGSLLLPPSALSTVLVQTHPLVLVSIAVCVTVLVRNRSLYWLQALAYRSRFIGRIYAASQKLTDRATADAATRVGGAGRAGRGITKGTEAAMDRFFAAIAKPFKRKRRNRW